MIGTRMHSTLTKHFWLKTTQNKNVFRRPLKQTAEHNSLFSRQPFHSFVECSNRKHTIKNQLHTKVLIPSNVVIVLCCVPRCWSTSLTDPDQSHMAPGQGQLYGLQIIVHNAVL